MRKDKKNEPVKATDVAKTIELPCKLFWLAQMIIFSLNGVFLPTIAPAGSHMKKGKSL
tara:strand:- start:52 stop:225 length:174 start_codon:yes stop_codon:yes gene_type:complete